MITSRWVHVTVYPLHKSVSPVIGYKILISTSVSCLLWLCRTINMTDVCIGMMFNFDYEC